MRLRPIEIQRLWISLDNLFSMCKAAQKGGFDLCIFKREDVFSQQIMLGIEKAKLLNRLAPLHLALFAVAKRRDLQEPVNEIALLLGQSIDRHRAHLQKYPQGRP